MFYNKQDCDVQWSLKHEAKQDFWPTTEKALIVLTVSEYF